MGLNEALRLRCSQIQVWPFRAPSAHPQTHYRGQSKTLGKRAEGIRWLNCSPAIWPSVKWTFRNLQKVEKGRWENKKREHREREREEGKEGERIEGAGGWEWGWWKKEGATKTPTEREGSERRWEGEGPFERPLKGKRQAALNNTVQCGSPSLSSMEDSARTMLLPPSSVPVRQWQQQQQWPPKDPSLSLSLGPYGLVLHTGLGYCYASCSASGHTWTQVYGDQAQPQEP